jgi:hypothetical protein
MFSSGHARRSARAREAHRGQRSRIALTALAVALLVGQAQAGPISFDLADGPESSVSASVSPVFCWGCSVTTTLKSGFDAITFSLGQGESHTFDFFKIRVGGLGGATVDVAATLGFDLLFGMSATGNGDGWYATLLGKVSGGSLVWNDLPTILTAPDGAQFSVVFRTLRALPSVTRRGFRRPLQRSRRHRRRSIRSRTQCLNPGPSAYSDWVFLESQRCGAAPS